LDADVAYLLVTVRAGPDFELAMPRDPEVFYTPAETQPAALVGDGDGEPVEVQASFVTNESAVAKCVFGTVAERTGVYEKEVMGPGIVSFRAMLKRYTQCGYFSNELAGAATLTNKVITAACNLHPCAWGAANDLNGGEDSTNKGKIGTIGLNAFRWLKLIYLGHRGGAKYRFRQRQWFHVTATGPPTFRVVAGYDFVPVSQFDGSTACDVRTFAPCEIAQGGQGEYADFSIPDTNMFAFIPGGAGNPGNDTGYPRWQAQVQRAVIDLTQFTYAVSHAVAEDFSFFTFCYVPCLKRM
jgi:hypothetical protein